MVELSQDKLEMDASRGENDGAYWARRYILGRADAMDIHTRLKEVGFGSRPPEERTVYETAFTFALFSTLAKAPAKTEANHQPVEISK